MEVRETTMDDILKTQAFDPVRMPGSGEAVPELVTLEGRRVGVAYPLRQPCTRIGRLEDNDLVLRSSPVSKHHAAVLERDGLFFIEDLGSTNGVLVNGTRVPMDSQRRLYHGDNIRISDHLFLFRQETSFVDSAGSCRIKLDDAKIDEEVREFLESWQHDQTRG